VIEETAYAAPALSGLLHPRQHHPLGLPPASPSYCDRISGEVSRLHSHLSASRRTHTLRCAFITAALDAGVPRRDVQEAASHADPGTTMRYDRARVSFDGHAAYIVAAYLAGAAR
jgi:integrase